MSRQISTRSAAIAVSAGALILLAPAFADAVSAAPAAASSGLAASHRHLAAVALPTGFQPEGVTSGPGDTYYAGSVATGQIWTGDLSQDTGRELLAPVTGRSLRGMQWDRRSGLLWTTGQDGDTGFALAVNARTGAVKYRVVIPGAGFLNDVVITRHALWVTDSSVDVLTRIPLDRHGQLAGALSHIALGAPWPTPDGLRANGIRQLKDGSLILDNTTAGGLWRVDPATGAVSRIAITGVPADSPGIVSGDGLELRGDLLFVVRGSGQQDVSVLKLRYRDGTWSARLLGLLTSPLLDVPSTATLVGHTLWAVNARFGVADPATADYQIVPLPLRSLS